MYFLSPHCQMTLFEFTSRLLFSLFSDNWLTSTHFHPNTPLLFTKIAAATIRVSCFLACTGTKKSLLGNIVWICPAQTDSPNQQNCLRNSYSHSLLLSGADKLLIVNILCISLKYCESISQKYIKSVPMSHNKWKLCDFMSTQFYPNNFWSSLKHQEVGSLLFYFFVWSKQITLFDVHLVRLQWCWGTN